MKRSVMGLVAVLGLMPGVASAALSLQIGPRSGTDVSDVGDASKGLQIPARGVGIPSGNQFFDLIFKETDPTENEQLFAYDLEILCPVGITLVGADRSSDNFVYGAGNNFVVAAGESNAQRLLINTDAGAASFPDLPDITTGKTAARIFYTIDPNIAPGDYRITMGDATNFGSGDPNRDINIAVDLASDAGLVRVTVVPEPAGLSLLGIAGLLALRRRRTA